MSDSRADKITKLYERTNSAMMEMFKNEKEFIERLHQINLCRPAFGEEDQSQEYQALHAIAQLSSALISKYPNGPTWLQINEQRDSSSELTFRIDLDEFKEYLDTITPLLALSCRLVDKGEKLDKASIENSFLSKAKEQINAGTIDKSQLPYHEIENLLGLGMQRLMRYPMTFNEGVGTASKLENIIGANKQAAFIAEAKELAHQNAREVNALYKKNPSTHRLIAAVNDSTKILTEPESPKTKSRSSSRSKSGGTRFFDTKAEASSVKSDMFADLMNADEICQMISIASASFASPELHRGSKPIERDRALKTLASELTEKVLQLELQESQKEKIYEALFSSIGSQNISVAKENFNNALQGIEDVIRLEAGSTLMNTEKLSKVKEALFTSFMQACKKLPPDIQREILTDARNNQVFTQSTSQSLGKAPIIGSFLAQKRAASSKVTSQAIKRIDKALKELNGGSPSLRRSSTNE